MAVFDTKRPFANSGLRIQSMGPYERLSVLADLI